jgi:L-iditol 2-dehydrogenase
MSETLEISQPKVMPPKSSLSRASTMRAAVLYGKEDVRVESIPVPKPGPGELLLRIGAALTCGTDLKVFKRGYHARMIRPPSVFGHECSGTVVEKGEGVTRFSEGDRVVVANSAPCGNCYWCRREQENLCENLEFLNGAYAEYLKVPARFVEKNTHAIPNDLSFRAAALVEPLACVVHGVRETAPRKGDLAAVIGLGPIGLMFVALLRSQGARVIGIGRHQVRLDLARVLGAEQVIDSEHKKDWVQEVSAQQKVDLVIEATGRPEIWEQAVSLVRKGGTVNLFGGCPSGTTVTLDTNRIHYDQLTLKSSFHHRPAAVREALDAITSGVISPEHFVTDEKPLEELPDLFRRMVRSKSMVKTCIRF